MYIDSYLYVSIQIMRLVHLHAIGYSCVEYSRGRKPIRRFYRGRRRFQPPVNRLGGEAFYFARKAIGTIKSGGPFKFDTLTLFATHNDSFDEAINLIYGLNDTLLAGVTAKQWKTIAAFSDTPELAKT